MSLAERLLNELSEFMPREWVVEQVQDVPVSGLVSALQSLLDEQLEFLYARPEGTYWCGILDTPVKGRVVECVSEFKGGDWEARVIRDFGRYKAGLE